MATRCHLIFQQQPTDGSYSFFPEIAKFVAKVGQDRESGNVLPGCAVLFVLSLTSPFAIIFFLVSPNIPPSQRYVLAFVDCCVWPNNTIYVNQCIQTLQSLLTMSAKHAAHVQVPLAQAQTQAKALVKHRRYLEDALLNCSLDILSPVTLQFDKSNLPVGDKRAPWHPCLFVTALCHDSPWQACAAAQTRTIGPAPLIRVVDMLGFDAEQKPGASARTEQFLGLEFHPFGK